MTRPSRENWKVGEEVRTLSDLQTDTLVSASDLLQRTSEIPEDGLRA